MLTQSSLNFLADLRENNSREWFMENKKRYEKDLKEPGQVFAKAFADMLSNRLGNTFETKVYRINRDVRFSKDKTPYNSHFHVSTCVNTHGGGPAFMLGIEPKQLTLGMGSFGFSPDGLDKWRAGVAGPKGKALSQKLESLRKGGLRIGEPELKRVPAPYPVDHAQAELLKHKGLMVWIDLPDEALAFGDKGPARCVDELSILFPLYESLHQLIV